MSQPNVPPIDPLWWAEPQLKLRLQTEPIAVLRERGVNVPNNLPPPVMLDVLRIVSLLWVDGRILPLERFYIDPADEGLLFGRGVWESTRTIEGVPWLWPLHLERLRRTAELLGIDITPDRLPDAKRVTDYVRALTQQDVVVRLNVTAGRPGNQGLVWMSAQLRPIPVQSVKLKSMRTQVLNRQPILTGKTFHYAFRLQTGQMAHEAGFDTALMLDANDNVLEAAHANIFLRMPEGWVTPAAESGLFLPGTVRQYLLQNSPTPIQEQTVPKSRLREASEVFLTNSNVGIVPVARIDDKDYSIGAETMKLQRWLQPPSTSAQGPQVQALSA